MSTEAVASDDEEIDEEHDQLAGYDGPLTIIRTTVKSVQDLEDILDDVIVYKKLVKKQKTKIAEDLKIVRRKIEQAESTGTWQDLSDHVDAETIQQYAAKMKHKVEHYYRKACIYSRHLDFWNDVEVVVTENLKENEKCDIFRAADQRRAINTSVYTKVNSMFQNKPAEQLSQLKTSIMAKIENGGPGVDIPYWEGLLQQLHSFEAKARLSERHDSHLKSKFCHIITDADREAADLAVMKHRMTTMASNHNVGETITEKALRKKLEKERKEKSCMLMYKKRSYSPMRLVDILDDKEYPMQRYHQSLGAAHKIPKEQSVDSFWDVTNNDEAEKYDLEAAKKAEFLKKSKKKSKDEELPDVLKKIEKERESNSHAFGDETEFNIPIKYDWQDKWRPRKPKYFNRVNTGFEWNRYNQTHYDYETPPPKVVTGYKFNVYYPDLIDKRTIPTYNIFSDNTNPEYSVIVLTAGPPYEDLAFRIVNKKMDTLERHGFLCEFRGGVFRLHFQYKRQKYKR